MAMGWKEREQQAATVQKMVLKMIQHKQECLKAGNKTQLTRLRVSLVWDSARASLALSGFVNDIALAGERQHDCTRNGVNISKPGYCTRTVFAVEGCREDSAGIAYIWY